MIEYKVVGAYITELRKKIGLTQTELAEQLNITHQAVSKLENGMALPDIEILYALSKLFKVSIEDILDANRKETKLIDEDKNILEDNFSKELTRRINEAFDVDADKIEDDENPIGHLCGLAPFLSREVLDKEIEKIENIDLGNLIGLAPFLSREAIDKAIDKIVDEKIDLGLLVGLAPFINKDKLDALFEKVAECDIGNLAGIAPFLHSTAIESAIKKIGINNIEKGYLQGLAPFISREFLGELYLNANLY